MSENPYQPPAAEEEPTPESEAARRAELEKLLKKKAHSETAPWALLGFILGGCGARFLTGPIAAASPTAAGGLALVIAIAAAFAVAHWRYRIRFIELYEEHFGG